MDGLYWLFVTFMTTLLFIGIVGLYLHYTTRADPRKEELTRQSFNIGGFAALLFLILLFLSPLIGEVASTLITLGVLGCLFLVLSSTALSAMMLFINNAQYICEVIV